MSELCEYYHCCHSCQIRLSGLDQMVYVVERQVCMRGMRYDLLESFFQKILISKILSCVYFGLYFVPVLVLCFDICHVSYISCIYHILCSDICGMLSISILDFGFVVLRVLYLWSISMVLVDPYHVLIIKLYALVIEMCKGSIQDILQRPNLLSCFWLRIYWITCCLEQHIACAWPTYHPSV